MGHRPGVDVPHAALKGLGEAELTGLDIDSVCVAELERPEESETRREEMPKEVGTVSVLEEDESLA